METTNFKVEKRTITKLNDVKLVGIVGQDKFHIDFIDDAWEGLHKTMKLIRSDGKVYKFAVINDEVVLTQECYVEGVTKLGFYGTLNEDEPEEMEIASTDYLPIYITQHAYDIEDGEQQNLPTPSQWDIIIGEINNAIDEVNDIKADTLQLKNDTAQLKSDTQQIKNDTQQIKNDTQAIKADVERDIQDFNGSYTTKMNAMTQKYDDYNKNATNKTNTFNQNATDKTNTFNQNVTDKTNTFNQNVTDKTNTFNQNATDKTTAYNNNAQNKVDYYNTNAENVITMNERLLAQIPTGNVEGKTTNVKDSSDLPIKDITIKGDASQDGTPTPSVPVVVSTVTGDVTVNVSNKNLYNATSTGRTYKDVTVSADKEFIYINGTTPSGNGGFDFPSITLPKGKYRLCVELVGGSITTSSGGALLYLKVGNSSGTAVTLTSTNNKGTTVRTLDSTSTCDIYFWQRISESYTNAKIRYQIIAEPESGGSADYNFEKHQEQTQLLSLGSLELCKIGNYQDYIYKSGDKWYKHKVIDKITLNGSEQWSSNTRTNGYQFDTNISGKLAGSNGNIEVYSNRFRGIAFSSRDSITESIYTGNNDTRVRILTSVASTSDAFKEWLESNNTIVYYILATASEEEITDSTLISQLNALLDLQTYKNISNIFTTTTGENPILNITYRKDLETLFNNLSNAIISLGNNI